MSYFNSPGFGIYNLDDHVFHRSSIGGLTSARRKNDGHWCPHCFEKKGMFEWVDPRYVCALCKKSSNSNDAEVKQLMKGR